MFAACCLCITIYYRDGLVSDNDLPDRPLQPGRAVQRDDVLRLLPEEQLQELPDVLHSGAVLPHLLLPSSRGSSWTVNETAAEMVPPPLPEKWSGCVSHGQWRYDLAS